VPVKASPTTTLGNIATHIARHLKLNQATIEHSITCGSGLQALANGMAWLRSGMADRVLAVASEAPLTGFTVAQIQALGIYSKETDAYPCKSGYHGPDKKNTMVLGEAAVAVCMERTDELQPGDIFIASIGFGLEELSSLTSIHPEGAGFQQSMNAAMKDTAVLPRIVIAHMPGTIKGDQAERAAIANIFEKYPAVLSNKWLAGHTLGASGLLSVEWAALLLNGKAYMDFPYPAFENSVPVPGPVMVNAMGFGGNAISIILSRKF
jgi:3-oxoacyl-(acyl-carrier-protein) synthase